MSQVGADSEDEDARAAAYWLWREEYLRENVPLLRAWSANMQRGGSRLFYDGRLRPVVTVTSPLL